MKNTIMFTGLFIFGILAWAGINSKLKMVEEGKSFEGEISFTKKTGTTESKYKYFVKGDKVRIEELGDDGKVQGIMIVNSTAKTIVALSPERKAYMDVPVKNTFSTVSVSLEKKESTKSIMEYPCAEWVATNKDEDRSITYWMAFGNFDFFIPFLKTINRKDKQAVYFLAMTGTKDAFPMLSIETKSDGTELSRLTVTSINKKSIEDSQFEIPAGFTKM